MEPGEGGDCPRPREPQAEPRVADGAWNLHFAFGSPWAGLLGLVSKGVARHFLGARAGL